MVYNARAKTFSRGQQVTIYSKTFSKNEEEKKKNEKLSKSYKNINRTKEQEEHCKTYSIKQTKNRIYDIARANEWDWFITLTFDRKKKDSSDYDVVINELTQFLKNVRLRQCPDMKYLIVPELHADGEHYHFHGLLANCDNLCFTYSGRIDRKSKRPIYNIAKWTLGFTTATQVQDTARVSSYITKYITKECVAVLKNKKRYYASHNIDRPGIDYSIVDKDEFLEMYGADISYCKTIDVPQASMQIMYCEFDY